MRRLVFLLLFGLGGTAILISLGVWQLGRLEWKQSVLAQIENRISEATTALPMQPDVARDKYLPVAVRGYFETPEIHVLVSVKQRGAGYRIITPFVTSGGRRVMVDHGFVDIDAIEQYRIPVGEFDLAGNLHWPIETDGYTPEPDLAANIWFARDVDKMAKTLGTEPVLVVLRSSTPEISQITPIPVDTAGIPNDHLQYAATWFSLAFIWLAMSAFFLRRKPKQKSRD